VENLASELIITQGLSLGLLGLRLLLRLRLGWLAGGEDGSDGQGDGACEQAVDHHAFGQGVRSN
jgi:hypothetical protein